ncbi:MAG TPA: hypothetical protein VGG76_07440, partial [Gemmatimonadaceae bacterium]
VPGDAIMTGRTLTFNGSVGGDYLGFGGNQAIGGHIHGSVRAVGGEINAMMSVDRNATIAGGHVSVDSAAVVGGNAYLAGANVDMEGAVHGSLMATGGQLTINGPVGRDVELSGGDIIIGPRAQIAGNLSYRADKDHVRIDPRAHVAGTTTALPPIQKSGMGGLIWLLGLVVAGIVVVALVPRFTTEAAEILYQRPTRSALTGLGWIFLLPIAMVIAAVTVIGIPLAIVGMASWVLILVLGELPVGLWIGKKLLRDRARPGRNGAIFSIFVGGLILGLLGVIPSIGTIVKIVAAIFGAGAIVLRSWEAPDAGGARAV